MNDTKLISEGMVELPFYINDVHQSCPYCGGKLVISININSTHGHIICDSGRHYLGHYRLEPEVIKEVFSK